MTLSRNEVAVLRANTARTALLALMVTVQVVLVPVQALRHSLNRLPGCGVAVRRTEVLLA